MTAPPDQIQITDLQGDRVMQTLAADSFILGRSDDADIQLPTGTVSRKHAELSRDASGRWVLRDLGSHNGTYVNDKQINESVVTASDKIEIGEFTLKLNTPSTPAPQRKSRETTDDFESTLPAVNATSDGGAISVLGEMDPPHVDTHHLSLLNHFGNELLGTEADDQRLQALSRFVTAEEFHGKSALVLRLLRDQKPPKPRVVSPLLTAPKYSTDEPHISATLLNAVLERGDAAMATNQQTGLNSETAIAMSIAIDVKPMAAMACPLGSDENVMDVLYVDIPTDCATPEWLALMSLAAQQHQQAELAWAGRRRGEELAALERDMKQAHDLQMRLVPQDPQAQGLDPAIAFEPCKFVGGDYADVLHMQDGRTLVIVADVCGKGMQAALTTSSCHTLCHAAVRSGATLSELTANLNQHLAETLASGSFVTAIFIAIDASTGELELVNAGHPPAFVVGTNGEMRKLPDGDNFPLGIVAEESPQSNTARLETGEWLSIYSDGLTELHQPDGSMIGIDGLATLVTKICTEQGPQGAKAVAKEMLDEVHRIQGDSQSEDDYTYLTVQRL